MKNNKYNDKEREFLRKNCVGKYSYEVADLFNKQFNRSITAKEIQTWKTHNGVRSGIDCRINKNWINPHPPKPLYSEMISYDNKRKITYIKTGKNKWEKKHLYMYKKYHGSIPKNSAIIFLNGNRDDFSKENLVCISKEEHRIMAGNCLYYEYDGLNQTGLLIAKLRRKVKNEINQTKIL